MTIILWLAAVLLGSVLGIAFGRFAAQLPIAAVAQSILAACGAAMALPVIVFGAIEVSTQPLEVSLRMVPAFTVMVLWGHAITLSVFVVVVAGLHAALGHSPRLAPRRPILLGILGGLLGVMVIGPSIERLNVASVRSVAADADWQSCATEPSSLVDRAHGRSVISMVAESRRSGGWPDSVSQQSHDLPLPLRSPLL